MSGSPQAPSAEFDLLGDSWEMAMEADGYAAGTRDSYRKALASFAAWLAGESPDAGPTEAPRWSPPTTCAACSTAAPAATSVHDVTARSSCCSSTAGLRLAELAGLTTDDVDVRDRMVYVVGKGSGRRGPRKRAVPQGIKAAQALDRYQRERRRHPWSTHEALWPGDRGRGPLSAGGIKAMIARRGMAIGLALHPHALRHTWAHEFRNAGGSEGDLMLIGG